MISALLAVLLSPAPATAAAPEPREAVRPSTATFACATPKGWTFVAEDDGVTYVGPRDADKVASIVTVSWIPPGDPLQPDVAGYLERLTAKPEIDIPGRSQGPVTDLVVAGRKAKRLKGTTFAYPHHGLAKKREIPMTEDRVVVPAARGYFVLLYSAPTSVAAKYAPVFEKVLKSFKPKL